MPLADRLGQVVLPRKGCAVCRYYDQLDESDQAAFDAWLDAGGNLSKLWRECAAGLDIDGQPIANPLRVQRARFSQCINEHRRGGDRVAS